MGSKKMYILEKLILQIVEEINKDNITVLRSGRSVDRAIPTNRANLWLFGRIRDQILYPVSSYHLHNIMMTLSICLVVMLLDSTLCDRQACKIALLSEEHDWCNRHAQDLKDLNVAWDKIQKEAEKIEVWDATSAKENMLKLQLAVSSRRPLRERFCTRGVDTADYTG